VERKKVTAWVAALKIGGPTAPKIGAALYHKKPQPHPQTQYFLENGNFIAHLETYQVISVSTIVAAPVMSQKAASRLSFTEPE
jgi:hypothetical protein